MRGILSPQIRGGGGSAGGPLGIAHEVSGRQHWNAMDHRTSRRKARSLDVKKGLHQAAESKLVLQPNDLEASLRDLGHEQAPRDRA